MPICCIRSYFSSNGYRLWSCKSNKHLDTEYFIYMSCYFVLIYKIEWKNAHELVWSFCWTNCLPFNRSMPLKSCNISQTFLKTQHKIVRKCDVNVSHNCRENISTICGLSNKLIGLPPKNYYIIDNFQKTWKFHHRFKNKRKSVAPIFFFHFLNKWPNDSKQEWPVLCFNFTCLSEVKNAYKCSLYSSTALPCCSSDPPWQQRAH